MARRCHRRQRCGRIRSVRPCSSPLTLPPRWPLLIAHGHTRCRQRHRGVASGASRQCRWRHRCMCDGREELIKLCLEAVEALPQPLLQPVQWRASGWRTVLRTIATVSSRVSCRSDVHGRALRGKRTGVAYRSMCRMTARTLALLGSACSGHDGRASRRCEGGCVRTKFGSRHTSGLCSLRRRVINSPDLRYTAARSARAGAPAC